MEKIIRHIPMKKYLSWFAPVENVLYFDIETTGLSAGRSMIYMIGMAYYKENGYEIIQLFAEQALDEALLIQEFLTFSTQYQTIVSFNGEQFDIPFIHKRMKYMELDMVMPEWHSLDLYKVVRKFEKQLHLENGKQKTVERFLGIHRQDKYTGGELIEVYRKYLINRESKLYEDLILHNFEDIVGLIQITDILSYCAIFEGKWKIIHLNSVDSEISRADVTKQIDIQCQLDIPVPNEWRIELYDGELFVREQELTIRVYPKERELKLFYKDYKNYYYLPLEDMAIHKSVAGYVDKEFRIKATKENCYTKCKLSVLRNFGTDGFHDLQDNWNSKDKYVSVKELLEFAQPPSENETNAYENLKDFFINYMM